MRRISALLVIVLVAACGRSEGAPPRAAADTSRAASVAPETAAPAARAVKPTVLFIGTSLTAGLGLDPDSAFTAIIQRRIDSLGLNYDVVNAGVSGETSAGALRRVGWLMRGKPDIVVLETGANDGLRGLGVDSMMSNIQRIIDSVRMARPSAEIVLAGMEAPPNLGPRYAGAFRRAFPAIARKNRIVLIPFLLAGVGGVDSLNQADGIHPNARGERIVADNVWRVLAPLLEQRRRA